MIIPWKTGVVALLSGLAIGWAINGWRLDASAAKREAEISDAKTRASEQARAIETTLQAALVETLNTLDAERTKANEEVVLLRDAVAAGAKRLRVAAQCPAAASATNPLVPGRIDPAAPELDAAARPAYFALVAGLKDTEKTLAACQKVLTDMERIAQR